MRIHLLAATGKFDEAFEEALEYEKVVEGIPKNMKSRQTAEDLAEAFIVLHI